MGNNKINSGVRDSAGKIIFRDKQHENFYYQYLQKCRYNDEYHRALVYCLGIDRDTREHVDRIYDFKTGLVRPRCLREGWQTSGSVKIVRLAFNLYCNNMPSVTDRMKKDEIMREACLYGVEEIFCCGYARYFWEAVRLRYPDECGYVENRNWYSDERDSVYDAAF